MKILIYIALIDAFFADWLAFKLCLIPRYFTWLPEISSLLILIYIFYKIASKHKFDMPLKYLFCICAFVLLMMLGFLLNQVSSGVMFSGMRIYLRYIPFFLVPAVWDISDKEFENFLKFILAMAFLQLPVVLYQRFVKYSTSLSGDPMGGTLGAHTSGVLSIFLLMVLAFYIACYIRDRINFLQFAIGAIIIILPTTMNETKITFALLPVCFIIPLLFGGIEKKKIWKAIWLFCFAALALFTLKTIYDFFIIKRWGYGIVQFAEMKGRLEGYADARWIPIIKTFEMALKDPIFFFFGVGAGNASASFTTQMTGAYVRAFNSLGLVSLGIILLFWEVGFSGTAVITIWLIMLFFDALKLKQSGDAIQGDVGLAMLSIIPIYCVTSAYFNTIQVVVINIPFWLLCGFLATKARSIHS